MKCLPIIAAVCAFAFCSCATLHQRDRNLLQEHGVAGPLYEKMLHQEPLALADITELSRRQVPVPFVIHYLRATYFVYNLKTDDVLQLKRSGVPREIIDYLLSTPAQFSPQGVYPYGPYSYGPYPYGPYGYGPYPYGEYYGPVYGYPTGRFHRW